VPPGDRVKRAGQGQVGGQGRLGEVGVAAAPVARVQGGGPGGGERAGQQPRRHRAVDDHPGLMLAGPRQHVIGRLPMDQAERRLDSVHVRDGLGLVQLVRVVVGQPDSADLAFAFEVGEGLPVLLDRRAVLGGPVHLVQIDAVHPQPPQRGLDLGPQAGRGADPARRGRPVGGVPDQAALGEHIGPIRFREVG
jgi:hypothetical protein